jgi:2,4-dienoyl-CoA reductase-like NADH-dependent reductase (Old Yellow Enzyme family)
LIATGGFSGESAAAAVAAGDADLVAFGRQFICKPDRPERLRRKLPFEPLRPLDVLRGRRARLHRLSGPCDMAPAAL